MIQANELRIGNWVKYNAEFTKVWSIYIGNAGNVDNDNTVEDQSIDFEVIEPIPLAPEMLAKCGFVKLTVIHPMPNHDAFGLNDVHIKLYHTGQIKVWYKESAIDSKIDSLHQLQNLYFALTGKELEVNL